MCRGTWFVGILAVVASPSIVSAQVAVRSEIVVPQRSVFGVRTSVSVPDRGSASLGGVSRQRHSVA